MFEGFCIELNFAACTNWNN